jgi:hypothetical protein
VVFSERTGQAVRRFAYDVTSDGFAGRDVSVLSSSIFDRNSIVDWTYQQHPFSTVWCVLIDGTMASFTFMEEQDIMAWATHRHAGGKVVAISTSHAVVPGLYEVENMDDNSYEGCANQEVFIVLEDKSGAMHIERMRPRCKGEDSVFNVLCLDSMETVGKKTVIPSGYAGVDATSGKVKYSGELTDGGYIGIPFESRFTSVYPTVGNTVGNGQFDVKGVVNVGLRLKESFGGCIKAAVDEGDGEAIRYGHDEMTVSGGKVRLKNHDCDNIKPRGANNRDGRITVTQGDPWPFAIMAIETDYDVEEDAR